MTGIVYKSTGSWYSVKTEDNQVFECRIKGKFRMKGIKSTNPIAVGDVVDFELDQTSDEVFGVIHNIHDRKNYIIRKSVNLSKQTHIIASNIDVVFLLVTINNPITTTSFIDRFLVAAEAYGIEAVLVFNKVDTFDEATLDDQLYLQAIYSEIGYQCLRVSAKEGKGISELKELRYLEITPGTALANEITNLTRDRDLDLQSNQTLIKKLIYSYLEVYSATKIRIQENDIEKVLIDLSIKGRTE